MKKYFFVGLTLFICISFIKVSEASDSISVFLKNKSLSYQVEIADTAEKAQIGLMNRHFLPQNQGMLFIFPQPQIIRMWMKNTYIPLDMIFFNDKNQIVYLYENAQPLDEKIITCPYPAQKVLELNAGEIKSKNIQLGDILTQ